MDNLNEKIWFVYIGDHHEGPFSIQEIKNKIAQGEIAQNSYTWKEGMGDWELMEKIPDFNMVSTKKVFENSVETNLNNPSTPAIEAYEPPSQRIALEESKSFSRSMELPISEEEDSFPPIIEEEVVAPRKNSSFVWIGLVLILCSAGGAFFYFNQTIDIKKWIPNGLPFLGEKKPEVQITGLNEEDKKTALTIIQSDLKTEGPRIGIFSSQAESPKPSLVLVSNLPNGAQMNVFLEGVSGTLLNRLKLEIPLRPILFNENQANISIAEQVEGGILPQGSYRVYIFNTKLEAQPPEVSQWLKDLQVTMDPTWPTILPKDRQIMVEKTFFLGGPKDSAYQAKLDEYLKERNTASVEVFTELLQIFETLKSQEEQLTTAFKKINLIQNRAQRLTQWDRFSAQWNPLTAQLSKTFTQWDEEYLSHRVFFIKMHKMIKATGVDIEALFGMFTKEIQKNKISEKHLYIEELKKLEETVKKKINYISEALKRIKSEPASGIGLPKGIDL